MSRKKNYNKKQTADVAPEVTENTTSPAVEEMPAQEAEVVKTDWKPIIKDFIILMIIMGVLGYACNLLKDSFAYKSPTDSLVSLIRKGDLKDDNGEMKDKPFLKELEDGVKKNADYVNTRDANERTPLMWAAYANFNDPTQADETDINRIYYIDALFEKNANIHATDEDGFNALHWAAWSGMRFASYKLVKKGIDINQPESNGFTPLMLAAMRGNATVVDLLLKMGADPSLKNAEGQTALRLVQDAEKAYKKRDAFLYGPVFSANREESYVKTCKLLAEASGKISDEELQKMEITLEIEMIQSQAASNAARKIAHLSKKDEDRERISLLPLLASQDKDIDLHHRVKGEIDAIKAMEASLPEPVAVSALLKVNAEGDSALHLAARDGKALCCYHLVAAGLEVSKKNKQGFSPLYLAALNGHTLAVEAMLSADKAEIKTAAQEALTQLEAQPDYAYAETILPMLRACSPVSLELKEVEFEQRREAADAAYAKAKAEAAAKAKADEEARIKAEEEARAKAIAEEKAKQEALVLAQQAAEEKTAAAEQALKAAASCTAEAKSAKAAAEAMKAEAEQAKAAAEAAKAEAEQAKAAANAAKAEAEQNKAAAEAAKVEAAAAKAAADAAKAEAEQAKAAAEAAKLEAEQAKAAADAAKAEADAAKAAAETPAPVEPTPAA